MTKAKSIGIKLYDGKFLPVLTENESKIKKVILTTVRDNQKKTIIELYEGVSDKCINNEYLGKIDIPITRDTVRGEPAIEFHLRLDDGGILYAKAWDLDSGQESEIQIEHSSTTTKTILPDTMADNNINENTDEDIAQISSYYDYGDYDNSNLFRKILLAAAAFIILALLSLGIFLGIKKLIIPAFKNTEKTKKEKIVEPKEIKPDQVKKTIEEKKETISDENKITGIKEFEGQKHFVRWGDNLWNICKKYYNDPWYYPSLAEKNNISNTRLIYAGTYIIIPPKSSLKRWGLE